MATMGAKPTLCGRKRSCLLLGCFAAKRWLNLARRSAVSDPERTSRPSYSITSSASAKSEGETTSSRLFAVLRLSASSNWLAPAPAARLGSRP